MPNLNDANPISAPDSSDAQPQLAGGFLDRGAVGDDQRDA
jgi:hypothetical protein